MSRPRPRAATRFGRGRLNVITRRLIQITFRDWRGDIYHGDAATIISKYRYRPSRAPGRGSPDRVPCARLTACRIVMRCLPHGERPHLPPTGLPGLLWQQQFVTVRKFVQARRVLFPALIGVH